MNRSFRSAELTGLDGPAPTAAELAELAPVARGIEAAFGAQDVHPSAGFVEGVMAVIGTEPVPHPAIAVGLAVRGLRLGAIARSLGDMWRVAATGGRPFTVRAQAGAFVLATIVAVTSVGGIAAAGAWQFLTPHILQSWSSTEAPPTPPVTGTPSPSLVAEPSASPDPSRSAEPGSTPQPTSSSSGPSETPSSGPPSESPSRTPSSTPRPTETPGQTETPQPPQTPNPGETPHPSDGSTDRLSNSG